MGSKNQLNSYFMIRFLISFAISVILSSSIYAQTRYWVFFTDKKGSSLNMEEFHPLALERRVSVGLEGLDSTDLPVSSYYLEQIYGMVRRMGYSSRWLNAVAVEGSKRQMKKIARLPFVKSVEASQGYFHHSKHSISSLSYNEETDLLRRQLVRFNGDEFISKGIDGKGIRIAVFDTGFPGVDTHDAFEHLRRENRIVATFDFTRNSSYVYRSNSHGTKVLSCIAGMHDDQPMGLATGADFLLAITEVSREPFSEEENWLAALEWADRNGAQIVNSSLGYTFHRYFPEQMDGKSTFISRVAAMAAGKGILVVNAAGNEGSSRWSIIGSPADADSIISVGGISPDDHLHIQFASHGPTVDGRMKPNVSAYGVALVANPKGGFEVASGTSFASPLVAGFAACAWQLNPKATAAEMLGLIEKAGDLYPYFDYAHGFGVPQANFFTDSTEVIGVKNRITFEKTEDGVYVVIGDFNPKVESNYNTTHLFWHIRQPNGMLKEYGVVRVYQPKAFFIPNVTEFSDGYSLWVNYLGETASFSF